MTLLEQALKYRFTYGWSVIPNLCPLEKRPSLAKWLPYIQKLPTREEITEWFGGKTVDNFGISLVTGLISNIVVVDIDEVGNRSYDSKSTLVARSGRGRTHLYYSYPKLARIGNLQGVDGKHIDIKGDAGVIVLPPSIHPDTRNAYSWVSEDIKGIRELPAWFIEKINEKHTNTISNWLPAPKIATGNRNAELYRRGCSFAGKCATGDDIAYYLVGLNINLEDPLPEQELLVIIKSVCKYAVENN